MTHQVSHREAPPDPSRFDPASFSALRFLDRSIDAAGRVRLVYGLDDAYTFEEHFEVPVEPGARPDWSRVTALLDLLHWVAGVSYFKTAAPSRVSCETGAPPPAAARLLEALYSEGLGEFAMRAGLVHVPRPRFPVTPISLVERRASPASPRVLVPVGGGKDSIVALEIVRQSGHEMALISVRDAPPIARTVETAGLPRLLVERRLDPQLYELNTRGALNGHVPITAIIACVATLAAELNGYNAVALANERSASSGNVWFDGIEVNHQFSKSVRAERLLRDALTEAAAGIEVFSLLRPASELAIARAFSRMPRYHHAFSSCNTNFRLDRQGDIATWCGDCPKCRFVFLMLAPFMDPDQLAAIFGKAMLVDELQFNGFARLASIGGHKPFECVGDTDESLAAIALLAADPRWSGQPVVRRLSNEVLSGEQAGRLTLVLTLSDEHVIPAPFIDTVRAVLGA